MSASGSQFDLSIVGDVTILRFSKQRLYDADKIEELSKALLQVADELTTTKLVLNLHGVDYFSSSAIGALIRLAKRLAQKHVALRLCELQPMVEEIMMLQRLHLVFDIQPDEQAALASLK